MKWFDFAWLKQWWPEVTRRLPHVRTKPPTHKWRLVHRATHQPVFASINDVAANTKSEARARLKVLLGDYERVPAIMAVIEI